MFFAIESLSKRNVTFCGSEEVVNTRVLFPLRCIFKELALVVVSKISSLKVQCGKRMLKSEVATWLRGSI